MTNLPTGWAWLELGELGDWYGGATPSKKESRFWRAGTVPWLSPKDMGPDVLQVTQDKISSSALDESPVRLVPEGSVALVVRSGILVRTLPVAFVPFATALNQDMKAIVPHEGIDSRWIAWGLRAFEQQLLRDARKSGTTVASLEASRLMSFKIPVAPLDEQRRIVETIEEALTRIDSGMAGVRNATIKRTQWYEALLSGAVNGEIASPSNESAVELLRLIRNRREELAVRRHKPRSPVLLGGYTLPNHWELASMSEISYSWSYGTSTKCDYSADGTPVLRIPNLIEGEIDSSNDIKYAVNAALDLSELFLAPGDVLFVRTNGSPSLIGRVGVARTAISAAFASYLIRFRLVPNGVAPDWVKIVMNSPIWRRYIVNSAASSAGQHNINSKFLASIPVPVPPKEEQLEIISKFEQWQEQSSILGGAAMLIRDRANSLRESVLTRAFSGRLASQFIIGA